MFCRSLFVVFAFCSCLSKKAPSTVDQNKVNNVTVEARFVPAQRDVSLASGDSSLRHDTGNQYLTFNIRLKDSRTAQDKKTLEYLDFRMQDDFGLVEGDTLRPVIVQRVANGQKGNYEYLVVFDHHPSRRKEQRLHIIYEDKIFGLGTQVFEFASQDIL